MAPPATRKYLVKVSDWRMRNTNVSLSHLPSCIKFLKELWDLLGRKVDRGWRPGLQTAARIYVHILVYSTQTDGQTDRRTKTRKYDFSDFILARDYVLHRL